MDKYFELEGRNVDDIYELMPDYVVEDEIYRIKVEIQFELGLFEEIENDIKKIEENTPKKHMHKFTDYLAEWKKKIADY